MFVRERGIVTAISSLGDSSTFGRRAVPGSADSETAARSSNEPQTLGWLTPTSGVASPAKKPRRHLRAANGEGRGGATAPPAPLPPGVRSCGAMGRSLTPSQMPTV